MTISVITVCRNSVETIRETLNSVLGQNHVQIDGSRFSVEYIVIDGGSTDGTAGIIKEFANQVESKRQGVLREFSCRWISEPDRGMYDALNKGLQMATGDVVGILNGDDVYASDSVLAIVAQTFRRPELDGVWCDVSFVRDIGGPTVRYCSGRWFKPWMFRFAVQPAHPSTFFRRECFEKFGDYSLDYGMYADFEFLLRVIWKNRAKMVYLPVCTTVMRIGGASTCGPKATFDINRMAFKAIRAHGYKSLLPLVYFKYAFKIWGFVLSRVMEPQRKKRLNVLILSLIYSPDNVSTAQIMAGLAEDLQAVGHRVQVVTTTPHFHRDNSMEAKQPLKWCVWPILKKSELNGVTVFHIPMPDKSVWSPIRVLSWIWFHVLSILIAPFLGAADIIIACSPPLTIGIAAWVISLVKRCRYIYNVQELYPDIAVNLGKMKRRSVIRFFKCVERFIYRHAVFVTSITEGMCAKIRNRTDPAKVVLIPNYVEIDTYVPAVEKNRQFSVCYAGNMGVPQYLGVMVEAARMLNGRGIRFVFAGGGQDEKRLRKLAEGLDNVEFRGYLPISDMPQIYAENDVFYVGQNPKAASDGIPSKIYRILGQRKPLLVLTAKGSDLEQFVMQSHGGRVIRSAEDFVRNVIELSNDPKQVICMGDAGYDYVKAHYLRNSVTNRYAELVEKWYNTRKRYDWF